MAQKPATMEGTKTRRPHAHAARTLSQIHEDRRIEQRRIARELYGELLPDIEFLQRKFPVNREGALIRVGGTLRTEDEVREIAARERRLEQPEPAMLAAIVPSRVRRQPASAGSSPPGNHKTVLPKPAAERLACEKCGEPRTDDRTVCRFCREGLLEEAAAPAACRCGRPSSHPGRCWARRGMSGPPSPRQHADRPPKAAPPPLSCEKCGRPRSRWSGRLCRSCYVSRKPAETPIEQLLSDVAALGRRMAAIERRLGIETSVGGGR